jgi:hypothetical protein
MQPMSYQRKAGDQFFRELLILSYSFIKDAYNFIIPAHKLATSLMLSSIREIINFKKETHTLPWCCRLLFVKYTVGLL